MPGFSSAPIDYTSCCRTTVFIQCCGCAVYQQSTSYLQPHYCQGDHAQPISRLNLKDNFFFGSLSVQVLVSVSVFVCCLPPSGFRNALELRLLNIYIYIFLVYLFFYYAAYSFVKWSGFFSLCTLSPIPQIFMTLQMSFQAEYYNIPFFTIQVSFI